MINKILESSKSIHQTAVYKLNNNIDVTEEECLEAVKRDGCVLQFVPRHLRTELLCLEAVKQNGWALDYVPEHLRTKELCLIAVKRDGCVLQFVPGHLKTEQLCLEAVKQDGNALRLVPKHLITEQMCLEASSCLIKRNVLAYSKMNYQEIIEKLSQCFPLPSKF